MDGWQTSWEIGSVPPEHKTIWASYICVCVCVPAGKDYPLFAERGVGGCWTQCEQRLCFWCCQESVKSGVMGAFFQETCWLTVYVLQRHPHCPVRKKGTEKQLLKKFPKLSKSNLFLHIFLFYRLAKMKSLSLSSELKVQTKNCKI